MIDLKDKTIVLFGNAESVFNKERQVNYKYDIICRINAGFPQGKERYIGSRTDILFLSLGLSMEDLRQLNPEYLVWCSPKREMATKHILKNSYKYDYKDWYLLNLALKARPSTGIMAFDYILQKGEFKTLTLIGFDFWKTPNWYTNNIHLGQHNPEREKEYIEQKIKEYKGRIKIE